MRVPDIADSASGEPPEREPIVGNQIPKSLANRARMPYDDYLLTDAWQAKRKKALKRADYRCRVCNAGDDVFLHVHHRSYENRGYERQSDLIVLCADCHRIFHENGRIR